MILGASTFVDLAWEGLLELGVASICRPRRAGVVPQAELCTPGSGVTLLTVPMSLSMRGLVGAVFHDSE